MKSPEIQRAEKFHPLMATRSFNLIYSITLMTVPSLKGSVSMTVTNNGLTTMRFSVSICNVTIYLHIINMYI